MVRRGLLYIKIQESPLAQGVESGLNKPLMSVARNLSFFPHRHILSTKDLTADNAAFLLDLSENYINKRASTALKGLTQVNLFFENSTRTQVSFELAGKRLSADVLSMKPASSSIKKGETVLDTAMTLNAMKPDVLVVRHGASGVAALLSQKVDCAVVNAGDGAHEHPTQALIDALTIRRRRRRIDGLQVAICGDILHSRVARSNIYLLKTLGASVRLIAPPTLLPREAARAFGVEVFHRMEAGLPGCDIVMILRLQQERMAGHYVPSPREYFDLMGLTKEKLSLARDKALVMHPGPMNRGIEIDSAVADDVSRSLVQEQVEMGVAVRMAVLDVLTRERRQ